MAEPTINLGNGNWAGKTDNLLGYYKEGERFYKQDFTFSRSTTGTYTDKKGYIQEMPYNKLQQSNSFDTTWSNVSSTETSNQSGHDGTSNAWLLTATAAGGRLDQSISLSGIQCISVYAKANTFDYLFLLGLGASDRRGNFDLTNGVVATTQNLIDSSIESIGDGWYRCSITYNDTISAVRVYGLQGDNDFTGTSGSIYIQDAQLVKGTSAKTYFPTTTRLNMPRVDYLNNSNGSLILEPQSTNTVTYSEDFSQWGNARTTDTANQITSPDGLNNGTLLEQQSGQTNAGSIFKSVALSSGTYAQSVFAKKKDKDFIVCYSANAERTYFNLSNGTIGTIASGNTAKIEDYGNGWYRCTITYTITSGGVIAFYLSDSDNSSVVTDSGGVYIYGAQLEAGSYSTTLINTSGSSVTRNQDACSMTNVADRIGQTEGTLYSEFDLTEDSSFTIIEINLGNSTNNRILAYRNASYIAFVVQVGGVIEINDSTLVTFLETNKVAVTYKTDEFQIYLNGSSIKTYTSGSIPSGFDTIDLQDNNLQGKKQSIKDLKVYDTALSDTELATLTGGTSTVYNWVDSSSNKIINENGDTIIFT